MGGGRPSSFAPPSESTPRRSCSTTGTEASSSTCCGSWPGEEASPVPTIPPSQRSWEWSSVRARALGTLGESSWNGTTALHPKQHAIERQPASAGEEQRSRRRQKNEVELPAAVSSESPVHLHRLEADRSEHDDGESGGRRLGQKTDPDAHSPPR